MDRILRKTASRSATIILTVAVAMAIVPGKGTAEEMTPIPMISGIEMLKVGDLAPDFSVQDFSGGQFNMKEHLGSTKGVLIFFWSIFCEPCKEELPVIEELAKVYQPQGIDFVGVAIDGTPMKEAINGYITQEGFSFKPLIDELNPDESFKISDPYGVAGTPTVYFIDKDGVVQFAKVGRASKEEIEQIIKQVL